MTALKNTADSELTLSEILACLSKFWSLDTGKWSPARWFFLSLVGNSERGVCEVIVVRDLGVLTCDTLGIFISVSLVKMLEEENDQSSYQTLHSKELDKLLGASSLFPSAEGFPEDVQQQEVQKLLQEKATLYQIAEQQGEFKHKVPPLTQKKPKKKQEPQDAGARWFHMKCPVMTPEVENDLKAVMLRRHLDPKRFYKKDDFKEAPKFFQIGTVQKGFDEPKSTQLEKSARKKPLVDQLLSEDTKIGFSKKKWEETHKKHKKVNRNTKKKH